MKETYRGKIISFKKYTDTRNGKIRSGREGEIALDNSDEVIPFKNSGCKKGVFVAKNDIVEFKIGQDENGRYAYDIVVVLKNIVSKKTSEVYQGKIISSRYVKGFSDYGNPFENYKGEIASESFSGFIPFDGRGFKDKKMKPQENDIVEFQIVQEGNRRYAVEMVIISKAINEQKDNDFVSIDKDSHNYFKSYQDLYDIGEYEKILRTNDDPTFLLKLFLQEPQLVLNAVAKFLGDNIENVQLNDFQKQLIYIKDPKGLNNLKSSNWSYEQFFDTAMVGKTEKEFKNITQSVIKQGFDSMVSRFWIFKNKLSFYLCVLWMISSRDINTQKKKCMSYFPDIASKENDYFVNMYPKWIKVCETFVFSAQNTNPKNKQAFYRRLIGGCLDYKKTDTLFEVLDLGSAYGYEEASYLKSVFENIHPSFEELCDIFDKKELGDGSEIYVNTINYLWSENKENSEPFVKLLIYLLQRLEDPSIEFDKIIKGIISVDKYEDFNQQDKNVILKLYASEHDYGFKNVEDFLSLVSLGVDKNKSASFEKILNGIDEIKNSLRANDEKRELLKTKICEYFELHHSFSSENDYAILSHLPFPVIEDLLLEKYKCNDFKDTKTTFALLHLYFSQNEMLKTAYIYTVSKKQRDKNYIFNLSEIFDCFKEKFNLYNINNLNNKDIIKIALRVLSSEEFDEFIKWAKRIKTNQTQYDEDSSRKNPFDKNIAKMLAEDWDLSYDTSWRQLLRYTLKEKYQAQDSLRFSIITSFFARYGENEYVEVVNELLDEPDLKKEYQDYYSTLWKGLISGQYSSNFLSLNFELIESAPITYWNIFYDYAVCKNHVFSSCSFWGEQWHTPDCDMQEFYDLLLSRYVCERETVFLKIAAVLLEECEEIVNPNFDRYLTYCQSIKDKDFILRMIIRLLINDRHTDDLNYLLNSGVWNCSKQENTMLRTLLSFVADKEQGLSSYTYLPKDKYFSFKKDILNIFKNFPDISGVYDIVGEIKPTPYYYTLFNNIFQICFDNNIFKIVMSNGLALPDNLNYESVDATLASYLKMIITVYKKQLQNPIKKGSNQYTIYVQNRYHRILASKLLLGKESKDGIENSLYELILSNGHEKSIKANFKGFKDAIIDFLNCLGEDNILSRWVLKGVITNNWTEFCNNIERYPEKALYSLSETLKYTRFQELNKRLLLLFIRQTDNGYEFKPNKELQRKVKCCSVFVGNVLDILSENDGSKTEYIAELCQLHTLTEAKAGKSVQIFNDLLNLIENHSIDSNQKELDIQLYTSALRSSVYDQTIVFYFRKNLLSKEKNISSLWKNVFGLMNCLDLYYYNLAVIKAENQKRNDAKADFKFFEKWQITYEMQESTNIMFPSEWDSELLSLKQYLGVDKDNTHNMFVPLRETEANLIFFEKNSEGIGLLKKHAHHNKKTDFNSILDSLTVFANKSLQLSEKLEDCMTLLNYVTGPDSFYDLLKKSKNSIESINYNEFLIISSAILITSSKNCSGSEKLEILFAMFEVFENLQEKDRIKEYNDKIKKEAVAYLFAPNNLFFDEWINNYGTESKRDIEKILKSCSNENSVLPVSQLIKSCQQSIANCSSEMQKLNYLQNWRQANRIPEEATDYEKSFVLAVDAKINELSLLPKLKLTISSDMIEDGKIYYLLENLDTSKACIFLDNQNTKVQLIINFDDKVISYHGNFNNDIGALRPGYACGQYFELPTAVCGSHNQKIEVIINIVVDGVIICNNKDKEDGITEFKFVKAGYELSSINVGKYECDLPAFSDRIKGIGREKEKENIKQKLLNNNLLILYGPSRVGKSSLLNYIRNKMIDDLDTEESNLKDRTLTFISVADLFNHDYIKNMIDASPLTDIETPEQIMDYLFISPLKIAVTDPENSRCKRIGEKELSDITKNDIKDILYSSCSILEKIQKVSKHLSAEKHQFWLIFDEFQQVIEKWDNISNDMESLCGKIATSTDGIKLILCGSDELVRMFECDDMVQWKNFRATISDEYAYLVEQLNEDDFCDMMKDRDVWRDASTFSDDALKLLHKYTGGNVISGKIFGNEILKELSTAVYSNRSCIYPSDITRVAYKLLSENENGSIATKLTDNTAKNLDDDAQNYLLYIAYILDKEPSRLSVSFKEIKNFFKKKTVNEIESSIKLLCARGLIKACGEKEYNFSTMFYFDFFNSKVYEDKIDELREIHGSEESTSFKYIKDRVVSFCNDSDPSEAAGLITGIIGQLEDESVKANIRSTIGETRNDYSTHISGDFIQNNIQINAQTINAAFTTLISDASIDDRLEAFKKLPKLEAFYTERERSRMQELQATIPIVIDDDGAEVYDLSDADIVAMEEIEEINSQAQNRYYGEMVSTMLKQSDARPFSSVFAEPTDEELTSVLGIRKPIYLTLIKSLPQEYYRQLCFAVALHKMILPEDDKKVDYTDIDFSPVSIMYCKLVEIMLKDNHLKLYGEALPELTITTGENFAELNDPKILKKKWKEITIGTFSWHLIIQNVRITTNGVCNKSYFKSYSENGKHPQHDKTPNLKRLSDYTGADLSDWKKHAMALAEVVEIRNSSAHGGSFVSKPVFDHLMNILFSDGEGEIMRIWDLNQIKK